MYRTSGCIIQRAASTGKKKKERTLPVHIDVLVINTKSKQRRFERDTRQLLISAWL